MSNLLHDRIAAALGACIDWANMVDCDLMADAVIKELDLDGAVLVAYSILSLLHHRGLVDSERNREDVEKALRQLAPFADEASRRWTPNE